MMRKIVLLQLLLFTNCMLLFPQDNQVLISGVVYDTQDGRMSGTTVKLKDQPGAVVSNDQGEFAIEANVGAVLVFSMVGYQTQELMVSAALTDLKVVLQEDSQLDEVVVTAFGRRVQREAVVGSVTTVNPDDLRIPSSNLTNALAGQVAGVIASQRSGQPGLDNSNFFIRGVTTFGYRQNPLILIDNVELTTDDLARLQVEDIESFSILKDASATALYGARGANGVILVTTKSGKEGSAKINVRFDQSISEATRSIQLADPITYMRMYNNAVMTRDEKAIPYYTEDDIYNRQRTINGEPGSNRFVYPVVDWLDLMFKDRAANQRATMNINGGGSIARYMVSASASNDQGIIKRSNTNSFDNNTSFKNYQLRSNVNVNISKSTELIVRLWGNFNDYNGPITQEDADVSFSTDLYSMAMQTSPVLFPAYYEPDDATSLTQHILFGNHPGNTSNPSNVGFLNPYAEMLRGYQRFSESRMSATLELNQDLEMIVPGLKFNGFFSTNRYSYFANKMAFNPFYYTVPAGNYDITTNSYRLLWLNSSTNSSPLPTEYLNYSGLGTEANTFLHFQGMLDYSQQLGDHHIGASVIGVRQQRQIAGASELQESLPYRNLNIAGRLSYNYSNRYFVEFNAGYNGSERFSRNNRFGFFPTVGASWIVSREKFWDESIADVISNLKLRASYGYAGNDDISDQRFFYLSNVNLRGGNGATFGENNGYSRMGVVINNYENPFVTWEKARILNTGVELSLFKRVDIVAEYWEQKRSNILMERYIPRSAGLESAISANVGTADIKGLDLTMNFNHQFSDGMWTQFMSNLTYSQGRYDVYEEPAYEEPWRYRSGTLLGQSFGYIGERLFVDDAEVAASPTQLFGGEAPRGGDIKYRDVNGDGVITEADQVPIGYPTTPQVVYGFGFSLGYKGFDFNARFQGAGLSTFFIDPATTSPFMPSEGGITQVLNVYADSYWSEENQDLYAVYPRLGTNTDEISNNLQPSTWWMRKGDFLRLKMAEVGYTLPQRTAEKLSLNSCRIFISGMNLLNFSKFDYWDVEQGGNAFNYPIQRVFNIGINVNFL